MVAMLTMLTVVGVVGSLFIGPIALLALLGAVGLVVGVAGHDLFIILRARGARTRRINWRVGALLLALAAGFGAAGYGLYVTGRQAYYVGFAGDEVVIFKGRPGGVLWVDPTLEQRTNLTRAAVPPARVDDVEGGKEFGSLAAAERYVFNLADETAGATTTTVPPPPPGPSDSAPPAAGAPITPTAPATSAP